VKSSNIDKEIDWECAICNVHPAGRYVSIDISNTGPGIPEEISEQIFEPFFTTKSLGRGLGLAAVAGIVQNHGGCVSFDSNSQRTTFHILLPMAKENGNSPGKETLSHTGMTLDLNHVH
jgi:signal transduction histidine kinase